MSVDPEQLTLAGGFPPVTDAQWEAEVLKVLNRGRPEGKQLTVEKGLKRLTTTTLDGLEIAPLYTAGATPPALGYPGAMPFTRGASVRNGEAVAWGVRQLHEDPDVALTRQAVLDDLERGATSVWLRLDPDAIPADRLADVLADVQLDLAAVRVVSNTDPAGAAQALIEVFKNSGSDPASLKGNLGVDALRFAALNGTAPDLATHRAFVAEATESLPGVVALTVDALPYVGAGADDVQELAFAIATGIEYLRDLDEAGISPDLAVSQLEFRVSATADQFMTIARLRALRRLWSRVTEVSGVSEALRGAHTHAVTSPRMFSTVDPYVNMLRATIATFGAATGGADAITVLPFDHAAGLPSSFSRRIARNTQVIAAEESNLGRVMDPAGGSWYVESLTEELAQSAWVIVGEIEAAGGMAAALSSGDIERRIGQTNEARAAKLATRAIELTGVSMFPLSGETKFEAKPRPDAPALGGLKQIRDAQVFEELREEAWAFQAEHGSAPEVFLACLGQQRDFGGRQGFASNVLLVGGLHPAESHGGTPEEIAQRASEAKAKVAVLASSAKVYADQAIPVAQALKAAGVDKVYLAGQLAEAGEVPDGLFDGTIALGMNVVDFLNSTFTTLGVTR
ncbi:MAG TPA: methylmalonyl-CoA mutase small subunit [Propioniciclava sp.]|jgi:methylmalonyl-CoA mutase|uniref:methylmalonyl-CoA mutase small subunit n=1 Tax=Propioniciclava sp. TaxID=2038686 RepID=UPI002BF16F81|nr:methylmalonyl-CoA mutase small subunit [Propioniciclava sp.]HRL49953.1 methylmalonyl-CoA mutase small subunit [Propioniciclava sp.]HRL80614.1 methylmalonyl-CoA mutase small subunit [Propioniciclava sp.]